METENPAYLAISPDGKFLYAAGEIPHRGLVSAYQREPDGRLTLLNHADTGGEGTCHVSVDSSGHNVLVANYGGGNISCFPIKADGSLGERSAFVQFTGSGPNPSRQTKPYAHSIYADAANHFVYACDLGTDNVWVFKFNAGSGLLERNIPPAARVPEGGGPRHLAFHPGGRYVYVNNEMGLTVSVFERNPESGALMPVQVIPTLPEGVSGKGNSTAEIACHPSGKWLYVSNRGEDTIAIFAIAENGRLTWIENAPAGVKVPRSFAIDPDGKWLVVAGQNDNKIAVMKIDPQTGRFSPTGHMTTVANPVCVLFAPL